MGDKVGDPRGAGGESAEHGGGQQAEPAKAGDQQGLGGFLPVPGGLVVQAD